MIESIQIHNDSSKVYAEVLKDGKPLLTDNFSSDKELLFSLIGDTYSIGFNDASMGKVSDLKKSLESKEYREGFQDGLEQLASTIENLKQRGYYVKSA